AGHVLNARCLFAGVLTMRCPRCDNHVAPFNWGAMARNFSHTDCPHCGAKIQIGCRTVILFLLMLASPVLAFAVVEVTNPIGLAETPVFPFLIRVMIPAMLVVVFLEWKMGRYRLDKKWDCASEQHPGRSVRMDAPAGYESDDRRVVDRRRAPHAVQ